MVAAAPHDWILAGPWYRWPRPGLPADGRLSVPEIQKYAHPQYVKSFLAEPQKSLLFDPDRDFRSKPSLIGAEGGLLSRAGQVLAAATGWAGQRVQARVLFRQDQLQHARLAPSGLLKLYQPVHERFYLVVAELHCDTGGFPAPARQSVCRAGFVLRRRSTVIDGQDARAMEALLTAVQDAQVQLAEVLGQGPLKEALRQRRAQKIAELKAAGTLSAEVGRRRAALAAAKAALAGWQTAQGVVTRRQRWVGLDPTDPAAKVGAWRDIAAGEEDRLASGGLAEHVIPMQRVHPQGAGHDAEGRALYFGVIPTTSLQHDERGEPRLDDAAVYELRCFVRHRRADCLRLPGDGACKGAVTWSGATRPFCIAPAMDLEGMANRPVTIRMPDLQSLQAQVATAADPGRFASMGFDQPQQLVPKDGAMPPSPTGPGGGAICFFPIPLVTIVALFLLNLFLPIILFIFNLWWMLALKFCIPPSIRVDAGLAAVLDAVPGSIDLSAEADVSVTLPGNPNPVSLTSALDAALSGMRPELPLDLGDKFDLASAARHATPPGAPPRTGRSGRFLEDAFYPRVTPLWAPSRPEAVL
jgi:hypothetical protein